MWHYWNNRYVTKWQIVFIFFAKFASGSGWGFTIWHGPCFARHPALALLSCFIELHWRALHFPVMWLVKFLVRLMMMLEPTSNHWNEHVAWSASEPRAFLMYILITGAWEVIHLIKILNTKGSLMPYFPLTTVNLCPSWTYMSLCYFSHHGLKK